MTRDFRQSLLELRTLVQSIDARLATGNIPPNDVEALKAEVDDVRLRIWASMTAASTRDLLTIERFRLRRAAQLCEGLRVDLEGGRIPRTLPEVGTMVAGLRALIASASREA